MSVTLLLSDIPAGVWADVIGRKRPLVIAHLLLGAGMVLTGLVTAFPLQLVAQVLWGLGRAFFNGIEVAWVTDELARLHRSASLSRLGLYCPIRDVFTGTR